MYCVVADSLKSIIEIIEIVIAQENEKLSFS